MLPYPCYLRVYEPLSALDPQRRAQIAHAAEAADDSGVAASRLDTLAAEQNGALTRVVTASPPSPGGVDGVDGVYVMQRSGERFYCPVDLPLRSWLSMTSLVESVGGAAARMIMPPEVQALADDAFLHWRRDNPNVAPHIRQATWGVPRTWFLMVVEDERTGYDDGAGASVRYRTRLEDATERLTSAHRTLLRVIDDPELIEEVVGLLRWLGSFDERGWLELDYAGIGALLGPDLATDRSAREIHQALDALSRGDLVTATMTYRSFEERWRVVNGLERAN